MKLFQRTLLTFFGIIVLQTGLTIVLVSRSIERSQDEDAVRELKTEALSVYDNFNGWKRVLWGDIVDLSENRGIKDAIARQGTVQFDDGLIARLNEAGTRTRADFLIAKSGWSRYGIVVPVSERQLPVPEVGHFAVVRPHPYIEMVHSGTSLYFCGAVRITAANGRFIDVFVLKLVDAGLCSQLSFNPRIRSLVSLGNRYAVGAGPEVAFGDWLDGKRLPSAYAMIGDLAEGNDRWTAIVQQAGQGRMASDGLAYPVYVTTFLSRREYRDRLAALKRIVISLSAVVAAFTLAISFGLTGAVTLPVRRLRDAMLAVKAGQYDVTVSGPRKGEIADLLRGFNEMAAQLSGDRTALDEYIREIVHLKEYNDRIFNSIHEGIVIVTAAFIIEKTNRSFLDCFRLEEESVIGRNIDELSIALFDESLHASIRAVISGGVPADVQTRRTQEGRSFEVKFYPLYESGSAGRSRVHCIMVIEDVSARIAWEEKVSQAEKLASVSMLSAGVAHEINNPLGSILTNVQNLIAEEGDGTHATDLRIIEQETKRIARIVRNLLDFSAPRSGTPHTALVNGTVEDVVRLLRYSVRKDSGIGIMTELADGLPRVAIGEDELKQVLINLIRNSLQAVGPGGTVAIMTAPVAGNDGGLVELSVRDTGRGIPPEILPRIFDPFFTTRGNEGNTGLGLSVVYGIVTQCHGTISVDSMPGEGATFRIILPAAEG